MGAVALNVADLGRQSDFYQRVLGLTQNWNRPDGVGLGAGGRDLVHLVPEPDFKRYRGVAGLYHFAILFPDRRELARAVARLFSLGVRNYPTDHIMTKTTYLDDLEGNGIELYAESPEDGVFEIAGGQFTARRADGTPSDGREPLDVEALLAHLTPEDRLDQAAPDSTRIGHVHLHVADVDEAVRFYHDLIGFDIMGVAQSFQAAFVSAGGYHHHLGLNTWQGRGAPPPPADALGLRYFTIQVPNPAEAARILDRVRGAGVSIEAIEGGSRFRDPFGNAVNLISHNAARNN
jgi:catechol 2,3-dioxygenase